MQDTFHSQFHALVKRAYPNSDVTWLVSVRGSTGCWHYCKPENFRKYVADFRPDCVFIGGISGWLPPDMPLWDMFTPAYTWLFKTGLPSEFYSRDYVHSGELGKQLIARIALRYFTAAKPE